MKPIIYQKNIGVRFADLDPYGHVNSSLYLDYIISSRFLFAKEVLDVDFASIAKKGVGFYLSHADMHFKRPLIGVGDVDCKSWVESLEGSVLSVPFEMTREGKTVSAGTLRFAVVSTATGKPIACPDWVRPLFWEE